MAASPGSPSRRGLANWVKPASAVAAFGGTGEMRTWPLSRQARAMAPMTTDQGVWPHGDPQHCGRTPPGSQISLYSAPTNRLERGAGVYCRRGCLPHCAKRLLCTRPRSPRTSRHLSARTSPSGPPAKTIDWVKGTRQTISLDSEELRSSDPTPCAAETCLQSQAHSKTPPDGALSHHGLPIVAISAETCPPSRLGVHGFNGNLRRE